MHRGEQGLRHPGLLTLPPDITWLNKAGGWGSSEWLRGCVAHMASRIHSSICDPADHGTQKQSLWVPLFSWLCLLQKGLEGRPAASALLGMHNILTMQYDAFMYIAHT